MLTVGRLDLEPLALEAREWVLEVDVHRSYFEWKAGVGGEEGLKRWQRALHYPSKEAPGPGRELWWGCRWTPRPRP